MADSNEFELQITPIFDIFGVKYKSNLKESFSENDKPIKKNLIIFLDSSISMKGQKFAQIKAGLILNLINFTDNILDIFNVYILTFSGYKKEFNYYGYNKFFFVS